MLCTFKRRQHSNTSPVKRLCVTRGANSKDAFSGQGLSEYALSVSLVAMVSLGGLMLVGNNLGKTFGNMKTLVVGHTVAITGPTVIGMASTLTVASTLPINQNGQSCYSNGWCLDMSKIQASTVPNAMTTGSNGMAMMRSNSILLDQLAQQAARSTTDPALRTLLTQLANSGHGVGNTSQSVITNGVQGKYDVYPQLGTANQTFATAQDALTTYLSSHPDILPVDVQQTITAATAQIKDTSNNLFVAAKDAADAYAASETTSTTYTMMVFPTTTTTYDYTWDLSAWTADPTIIQTDSNTVCNNGGNTSQCVTNTSSPTSVVTTTTSAVTSTASTLLSKP
jgi:hypothetical protein